MTNTPQNTAVEEAKALRKAISENAGGSVCFAGGGMACMCKECLERYDRTLNVIKEAFDEVFNASALTQKP